MNSFVIAYRSILERGVASFLTMLSMALGVGLVVAVLSIHGVVATSFRNNASLGYNVIVGAKGGQEQLTLNTVYYLHRPVENVRYQYYMEFLRQQQRDEQLQNSLALRAQQLREQTTLLSVATGLGGDALAALALQQVTAGLDAKREVELGRNGKHGTLCQNAPGREVPPEEQGFAIPLCLGDYLDRFRVVGTTPQLFNDVVYSGDPIRKYEFAQGRNFQHKSPEHGYFESVLGAQVAREIQVVVLEIDVKGNAAAAARLVKNTINVCSLAVAAQRLTVKLGVNVESSEGTLEELEAAGHQPQLIRETQARLTIGDEISPAHGAPDGHVHQRKFTIVGILASSGTPNDRAVFVNMEGFYLMEDHAKPLEEEAVAGSEEIQAASDQPEPAPVYSGDDPEPLPIEQREVTAILIRTTNPLYAQGLHTAVNEGGFAQAVFPVQIIYQIFDFMVRPVQQILLLLTVLICMVSGISILVSIYNSMSERRHEIAVMRALGAGRGHILWIVLLESILLALGGGLAGFVGGHTLILALAPYIEQQTGVQVSMFHWDPRIAHLLALFSMDFDASDPKGLYALSAEFALIPLLLAIAVLVGLWPAISAYRTDVAKSLGK